MAFLCLWLFWLNHLALLVISSLGYWWIVRKPISLQNFYFLLGWCHHPHLCHLAHPLFFLLGLCHSLNLLSKALSSSSSSVSLGTSFVFLFYFGSVCVFCQRWKMAQHKEHWMFLSSWAMSSSSPSSLSSSVALGTFFVFNFFSFGSVCVCQ